jgi:nanoRNase/pAp phosphatase (c-di-AMP/oligoRNAs hydrolase)
VGNPAPAETTSIELESTMSLDWNAFAALIEPCQNIVLTSHVRPDADAIGSEIGLCGFLEQLGKTVRIVNPSPTPKRLAFLDPANRVVHFNAVNNEELILNADAHIVVDTSAWGQLGDVGRVFKKSAAVKIVIDHHVSSDNLEATVFKDVAAEASGTLIFRLGRALGLTLNPEMATALYAAIATDTGWFRFPSTTDETYHIAGDLMTAGVRPYKLYEQLYENYSLGRLKLISRILSRVELECDGKLAHTYVQMSDYGETRSEPSDTEDLVNECLGISGVEGAAIFVEQPTHMVKVSLRSHLGFNIARVAEQFKGGGHKQAAGAMVPGPISAAKVAVIGALKAAIAETDFSSNGQK